MIDRVQDRSGLYLERLAADSAYGVAEMLKWWVNERGIEPHVPLFDKGERTGNIFIPISPRRSASVSLAATAKRLTVGKLVRARLTVSLSASKSGVI
jgi:hypothetical protein